MLIGIAGYSGVGKDTVRSILCESGYRSCAFADKLRELTIHLNPYFPEIGRDYVSLLDEFGYEDAKRDHPCVRKYLVKLGNGLREIIHRDVWIDALLKDEMTNVCISDVRYANEANRIKELGGVVWMLDRPGFGPDNATEGNSVAEIEYDCTINNNGTLDDLKMVVSALLATHPNHDPKVLSAAPQLKETGEVPEHVRMLLQTRGEPIREDFNQAAHLGKIEYEPIPERI